MLWLALHFPQFGLEVAERAFAPDSPDSPDSPEAREQPRVLVRDNRVLIRNAAAAQIGVQIGSTLATAHSLAAAGTPLQHLHEAPAQEEQRLSFLGDVFYRFSSEVSLEPPHAMVFEIGRSLRLFGSHRALEQAAKQLCVQLGHEVCARTAPTPSAALALARCGAKQLAQVPLSSLPLPAKLLERFANMGMHDLSQVLRLPSKELGHRFGRGLTRYLAQLEGRAADPRKALKPRVRFSNSLHLLEPLRNKDSLEAPMQQLLGDLAQWLTSHQLGTTALVWRFVSHHRDSTVRLPVMLSKPQQSARAFFTISLLRLAHVELPEDVLTIALDAHRLEPWSNQTLTLFRGNDGHTQTHANAVELAELLDQFCARLGTDACLHLHSVDQHAPERAWSSYQTHEPQRKSANVTDQLRLQRRPLWLFNAPRPVSAKELRLLEGPERIQTSWWAGIESADQTQGPPPASVSRDYYIAEHASGARCWAFCALSNQRMKSQPAPLSEELLSDELLSDELFSDEQWYLHGYFA